MHTTQQQLTRGYAVALTSAIILSTTAIFISYLTKNYHIPALVLAFWRELFTALALLIALAALRPQLLRVTWPQLRYLFGYGVVLALFNALWTSSVAISGAAISTVLVYCSTGFTALLGWWLLGERMSWEKLVAVALCLGGCAFVAEALDLQIWRAHGGGLALGLLSGLGYAIYSLMGRSAAQRGLSPWSTLLFTFGIAAGIVLLINLLGGQLIPQAARTPSDLLWLGTSLPGWGTLALLAIGPTLLGFGLYNSSLGYLPASVANLIATLEPAFTALIAYFLLGERLSGTQIFGSLLILGGVVFLRIHESRPRRSPADAAPLAA